MATADSVKANIQNIIAKANNTTGRTAGDMASAVDALISGFGQGGAVSPSEPISVVRIVSISADVTGTVNHKLLSGDEFIKEHYADESFSVTLIPLTPVAAGTDVVHFNYQGNRNIGADNISRTGIGLRSTNASTVAIQPLTSAIKDKGYSQHLRVDSSGNLYQYLYSGYVLSAGTYQIILTCTENDTLSS